MIEMKPLVNFLSGISVNRLLNSWPLTLFFRPLYLLQHDIPESLLRGALDGVVEDCVSFVGVDLNMAGISMLR